MAKNKKINICGIPHTIVLALDEFGGDIQGEIDNRLGRIKISARLIHPDMYEEALCHEIVHGMLIHIGRNDLSEDEVFVQSLANAIFQSFTPKVYEEDVEV